MNSAEKKYVDNLKSLLDGVKNIVEIYKPKSPAQKTWKDEWINNVNEVLLVKSREQNSITYMELLDFLEKDKNGSMLNFLKIHSIDADDFESASRFRDVQRKNEKV